MPAESPVAGSRRLPSAARIVELLAMLVPTALAAGLVLYDLGERSLWIDEGDTFSTAGQHGAALWHWALNDGGNMVAYYLGMHFFTEVFGTSEIALRLPTALAAIATVPTAFLLLRRLLDLRAATFGAFFVAASLPAVWWSQTARGYLIAVFLVTASCLALVLAIQTRRRAAYVAYVACSVLAVYTILLSVLVIGAQAATLALRRREDVDWRPTIISGAVTAALCVPAAAAALIRGTGPISWLGPPGPLLGTGDKYIVAVLASARTVGTPVSGLSHVLLLVTVAAWLGGAGLLVLSLVRTGRSEQSWAYMLLVSWLVVPLVLTYVISLAVHPILSDRYVLGTLPAASMLAGVACSRLGPLPVAAAVGVALVAMRAWVIMPAYGQPLENWRATVATVAARSQPHDCISFYVADGFDAFDYYALRLPQESLVDLPRPVLPAASYTSHHPYVLDPLVLSQRGFATVVASCPRMWLVVSHPGPSKPPKPDAPAYTQKTYDNKLTLLGEIAASYKSSWHRSLIGVTVTLYDRLPAAPS